MLSYRAEQGRLQNEMNLVYQVYIQMSPQLWMLKAKVSEITLYTVIQPATVTLSPAKLNKIMSVWFVFFGWCRLCSLPLICESFLKEWRSKRYDNE